MWFMSMSMCQFVDECNNFLHAMVCRLFDFCISVNDQFFARCHVSVDPRFMVVVTLLDVFKGDGLALASSFIDALQARIGVGANVDEACNRQVAHKFVKPHVVNGVFVVFNVAAVIEHSGKDVAVGLDAALGDNDATTPCMLANRLA